MIDLRVAWATHDAASYACKHWHYSRSLPCGKLVKVGAWENDRFIGVVVFGRGASRNLSMPYNLQQDECVELTRIAMRDHQTPVSQTLARALRFLKRSNPRLRLVISFADTVQGHHGGIYQASNWIYTGTSNPDRCYKINGKQMHKRQLYSLGYGSKLEGARKLDPLATVVHTPGKHRYLMPLDKQMRRQVQPLQKPYPKRTK